MINLLEELVLLAIEDDGAIAYTAGTIDFRMSAVGACLVDLNQLGRIDVDLNELSILSREPTGNAALDLVLRKVAAGSPRSARAWVDEISRDADQLLRLALDSLDRLGILTQQEKRLLWVLKSRRYPLIDGAEQEEAKMRIISTLFGDQLPTPHDTVLIGLAQVGKLLQGFLATSEIARMEDRLRKVGGVDLIVQEVAAALREAQIATANFALRSSL